ncbi:MAG: DUF1080 domain-containing protein [Pedosphaera sp.]|nr:DUF1080 domain-containing protein [Pedosphaera sp.]
MMNRFLWLGLALTLSARGAERAFDFAESALDQPPVGFRSVLAGKGKPGEWKIVMDEVPPLLAPLSEKAPAAAKRPVLAQVNQDPTDERFPLLVFDGETFSDFTLTTRFKLMGGGLEQMAGIAFRLQDEKNFYVIRASAYGNNIRFYKMVNGERGNPIGPEVPVAKKVWHELKIRCKGNQIEAWFNNKQIIPPLTDNSFTAGKIAFWTKSDSLSYFTDTKVVYTPRIPLAQTVVKELLKKNSRLLDLKIYTAGADGEPRVAGSKDEKQAGAAGGKIEKDCLTTGRIYYGKDQEAVSVVMPVRDRNGDAVAAVRLRMTSFTGQTEQNALARARPIVKDIQARVQSLEDLIQ